MLYLRYAAYQLLKRSSLSGFILRGSIGLLAGLFSVRIRFGLPIGCVLLGLFRERVVEVVPIEEQDDDDSAGNARIGEVEDGAEE